MIAWPPKGLAGSAAIQAILMDFFERNTTLNLPTNLNVRGHPTAVKYHIILGPSITNTVPNIANFIANACGLAVALGPINGVDGDGLQNWVSFSRDLRVGNPKIVAKICLLCSLHINNLIAWP